MEGRRDRWSGYPQDWGQGPDSPGPLIGTRVAVALGVGMLDLARFVEDDPWWGQDSLMT